jgi:hypothetical protein
MNIERSTISVLSFGGIPLASVSQSLGRQLRHPHKVIRRSYPPSRQLCSLGSPISRFPKSTHRLGPAENLFNPLSYPLTDAVTLMACGAPVNGRTALAPGVGCHMGNDLSAAQKINKAVGVVVLVRSQRFDPHSLSSLALDHLLGRLPLRRARGLTDFEIDQKPVSVLHQRMRPVTQLGLFARPLAGQQTLGIGLRFMGLVAAFLPVEVPDLCLPIDLLL